MGRPRYHERRAVSERLWVSWLPRRQLPTTGHDALGKSAGSFHLRARNIHPKCCPSTSGSRDPVAVCCVKRDVAWTTEVLVSIYVEPGRSYGPVPHGTSACHYRLDIS